MTSVLEAEQKTWARG